MVLNTTEFLCCFDKEAFFSSLVTLKKNMYAIRTILMVDDPTHGYSNPRYGIPLSNSVIMGEYSTLLHLPLTTEVD